MKVGLVAVIMIGYFLAIDTLLADKKEDTIVEQDNRVVICGF